MRGLLILVAACGRLGFSDRTGVDSAITADVTIPDSTTATGCGTTTLLADNFEAATPAAQWYAYANGGITTVQTGGQLVITLPATTTSGSNYGGYDSTWSYDLRGGRVYVEVIQVTSVTTNAQTDLQVIAPNGDALELSEENGQLYASGWVGTTQTTINAIAYDAGQDKWWQFREAGGMVYFETSPDGVTFTPFAMTPTPPYIASVDIAIEGGTFQTETNAGAARFDNFNGGTASGTWCGASTLRDDFSSGTIDNRWGGSYAGGGCSYSEGGGVVSFPLVATGAQDCALVSSTGFDLRGDAVFTELATAPSTAGSTYAYLRASAATGDNVELTTIGTQLVAAQNVGGTFTSLANRAYAPATDKFFRIAESGGNLSWDTSPDGMTWTNLLVHASPIAVDAVNLAIGAGTNNAVASPGTAQFATFNQLPP